MDDPDDKIVSLDERRRADAARQKAEIAQAASARRKANGGFRPQAQPRMKRAAAAPRSPGPAPQALGGVIGRIAAIVVWGVLIAAVGSLLLQRFG